MSKMPNIGETARGIDVGLNTLNKCIWATCVDCGKERWVMIRNPPIKRCQLCSRIVNGTKRGKASSGWKGGRHKSSSGYIHVMIQPDDPYYPMVDKRRYVAEHRIVMARHLGRCLLKNELIHHINGVRDDNRLENLELISPANHLLYKQMCTDCELRKEIRLLRWQVMELTKALQIRLGESL